MMSGYRSAGEGSTSTSGLEGGIALSNLSCSALKIPGSRWVQDVVTAVLLQLDPRPADACTDNDISSGSFGVRQVKNTLAGAYEMLQARLFQRAELIAGRKSGRLSNDMDPDDMSILAGVMGITKEVSRGLNSTRAPTSRVAR
jgi:DNA polymerase sigma